MANYDSNYEIAQEISARIGASPVPFDSVYSIALNIYQELGGEGSEFDSVYSILLEILDEVAESPNIIHNVSELPDAYENKNKIVRLQPSDDLYQSVLVSSEETNKLPDDEQIDKAYIYTGGVDPHYKGVYKIICADGELNWFLWENQAENFRFATALNAVECTPETPIIAIDSDWEVWSDITESGATTTMTMQEVEEDDVVEANGVVILATYIAPESAQIGNARCQSAEPAENGDYIYTGDEVCLIDEENEITLYGYAWAWSQHPDYLLVTLKKASEMYEDDVVYVPDAILVTNEWTFDDLEIPTYIFPYSGENIMDYLNSLGTLFNDGDVHIEALNAPDSEQVGNAKISIVIPMVTSGVTIYTAEQVTITYQSEEITGYKWVDSNDDSGYMVTTEKAEDLYSLNDCDIYTVSNGTVTPLSPIMLQYASLSTKKYKWLYEVWQWKQLQVGNKIGTYKIYIDEQVCDDRGYSAESIIQEIVSRQLNDRLGEFIHKILDIAGGGIDLVMNNAYHQDDVLHYLYWDLGDIYPQLSDDEYEEIMNDMATAQEENYDEGNWLYVAGIQFIPIFTVMPDLDSLGEDINELQTYLAFPLNTDDKIVLLNN